ncbi:MAG: UDP-N-acetylmuramoyl-tripeptide--D-alanyl-D-alanine ligase [Burkholderiales bacterium]|nr:UDP-N-acetylmuramoyl-tripeptide--D-alanyl-D-alanine ligase [Burkholderiales bacterium]
MDTNAAAQAVRGRPLGGSAAFRRVTTDSRDVAPGDLFVALRGEHYDGHDFVGAALDRGAVGAIVADARAHDLPGVRIAVADPLAALGELAAHWRRQFTLPVVVIVGSNGKTTVKEMTAAILREEFGVDGVLATRGNRNNAIGLPLTLLALDATQRAAVIELGMNHRGETRELVAIAAPTIVLVNNAQREHQEFMASVADVAAEHADAIAGLAPGGVAIVNADDAHADLWRSAAARASACVTSFGFAAGSDVTATLRPAAAGSVLALNTPVGHAHVNLTAPGVHMARNALAAAAAAIGAGASIGAVKRGLASFRPVAGRLVTVWATGGACVLDDSYNANPDSMRAAIDVLAAAPGIRVLVVGDMGEVGAQGPAFHREVGAHARERGIDRLYALGAQSAEAASAFGAGAAHFTDVEALSAALRAEAGEGVTFLVKGSRFMRMERVVAALTGRVEREH